MAVQALRDTGVDHETFRAPHGRREATIQPRYKYDDGQSWQWYVVLTARVGRRTITRAYYTLTKTDARSLAKDWVSR